MSKTIDCRECMGTGGIEQMSTCRICSGSGKITAPVVERQDIQDWAIDHSAGRPILTLKGCSVIEAEDAAYVLSLVLRDQSPPAPVAVVVPKDPEK